MHGEVRKLASIPCSHSFAFLWGVRCDFVSDVETVASGAEICTYPALYTAHGFLIPEGRVKHVLELWRDLFDVFDLPLDLFFCVGFNFC